MKKVYFILFALFTIIACKKAEFKSMEGIYSGTMTLSTSKQGIITSNKFDMSLNVKFKGNKHILIETFHSEKMPYNSSQKTFRKEEGSNESYYGYFINDSLFLEFKAEKTGTTYFYKLKKNL